MSEAGTKRKRSTFTMQEIDSATAKRDLAVTAMKVESTLRTPKKFVARLGNKIVEAMTDLAKSNGRSMNAECIVAVYSWFTVKGRHERLRDMLKNEVGEYANSVLASVTPLTIEGDEGLHHKVFRLSDGMSEAMEAQAKLQRTSQQKVLNEAIYWWLNISRESNALMNAFMMTPAQEEKKPALHLAKAV